ncbi:hypothetical protein [Gynuella sunshinyii]|nr:hypothetical protein [Gynuella sunshinyii]
MKEISLPMVYRGREYVDGALPKGDPSDDYTEDLSIVERNCSKIISAAIIIEDRMISAVSKIIFTKDNQYQNFFVNEIMGTSDSTYVFKRRVFTRLIENFQLMETDRIKKLKAELNKVMSWRNAFAHGKLVHEHNGGFILEYYSGGSKDLLLDNRFFDKAEETIRYCVRECDSLILSRLIKR